MELTGVYPVLMVRDAPAAAAWFCHHFDFAVTFETDWYVSLRRDAYELAFVAYGHETVPESSRAPIAGLLINVEIDDVDAEYRRLVTDAALPVRLDLRTEEFGQRHFVLEGPEGVLVDVIAEIAPGEEYADAFRDPATEAGVAT